MALLESDLFPQFPVFLSDNKIAIQVWIGYFSIKLLPLLQNFINLSINIRQLMKIKAPTLHILSRRSSIDIILIDFLRLHRRMACEIGNW